MALIKEGMVKKECNGFYPPGIEEPKPIFNEWQLKQGEGLMYLIEGHVKKGGVNPAPTTPKPQIRPPAQKPRKLKFLASAIDESHTQIKKIVKKGMDSLSSRMISADEYEYTSGDIHRKFIDSLRKDVKRLILENARLTRLMPHIGGTCKRFAILGEERVYGYCNHPTGVLSDGDGIALRCVINTKCENEAWELKD